MKEINGFERYLVSENGEIFRDNMNGLKKVTTHLDKDGYARVYLSKSNFPLKNIVKCFGVHRIVAQAFINNPNGLPIVNHKNFKRDCNHISNLEWATNQENITHGVKAGHYDYLSTNPIATKYSDELVVEEFLRWRNGQPMSQLKIPYGTIHRIIKGTRRPKLSAMLNGMEV